jgi:hypothetical protein
MRRAILVCALVVLCLPAAAQADPPGRVTIIAIFNPITYGENAYVNGQLVGEGQAGQLVALEQSAPPFTEWTAVAQTTTDQAGYYSFKQHPSQTLQYRTSSQGTPSEKVVQVDVAPRIKLKAEAVGKTSVRYSGTFAPALDGQSIAIQRRDASGAWTTVSNQVLRGGKTFQGRLRATKPVTLRALFTADGSHLDGFSNAVRVVPGSARAKAKAAASCAAPRISRIAFKPEPPVAGSGSTLRVTSDLANGRIYAVDVRWGEDDARDHFTLAPSYRKPHVTFTLRHRYKQAGSYRMTLRVYAIRNGCKSRALRTLGQAVAAPR